MCVMCFDEPAAEVLEARLSAEEYLDRLRAINAERAVPDPTCTECEWTYHPGERGEVFASMCCHCQARIFEDLVFAVAFAKSRKKARKHLRRLYRRVRRAARQK